MNMPESGARRLLAEIFAAGVAAVAPDAALRRIVRVNDGALEIAGEIHPLKGRRARLLGAGKGAAPLAAALEEALGDHLDEGLIVVKYGHESPLRKTRCLQAGHPIPDKAGEAAAEQILSFAARSRPDDLLFCVFTGGASALLPAALIRLEDMAEVTRLLLQCGAPIEEVNIVRRRLSRLGGGKLALAAQGAQIISFIISDVIGDRLEAIAGGPAAPDPASWAEARAALEKRGIWEKIPPKAREIIIRGMNGELPENPGPDDPAFSRVKNVLCATNRQALAAAAAKAEKLGFAAEMVDDAMRGEARETARELCALALARKACAAAPLCLLAGGETTVTLRGGGLGGRNQEMALAANIALAGAEGICALFAGTDGTDGPTDAAGGFALPGGLERLGGFAEAEKHLAANDSFPCLARADLLFTTGPTRTNVMDLAIFLIWPFHEQRDGGNA